MLVSLEKAGVVRVRTIATEKELEELEEELEQVS